MWSCSPRQELYIKPGMFYKINNSFKLSIFIHSRASNVVQILVMSPLIGVQILKLTMPYINGFHGRIIMWNASYEIELDCNASVTVTCCKKCLFSS